MSCIYLGEKIGSEPTLPYLSPELNGEKLLVGANFASAGVGILNDTGFQFVSEFHVHTLGSINQKIGSSKRT